MNHGKVGAYGGNIELEINNKKYKIERFFGKKEADDTFKLYDLSTNLESNDYTSNIGEEIFKLNKEAFERSTFISGQNMETSMNDSISAKLGNILESENDVNTSDKALKKIEEAIKNYKKTGGRGEINEKIEEKTKLEKKLEQSKFDEKNLQERKNKNSELNEKIKEKQKEQEELKKQIALSLETETKKAKLENYKMLIKNIEESKSTIKEYDEFFKNGIPTDDEIQTLSEKCLLIEKYNMKIKDYDVTSEDRSEIEELKELFEDEDINEDIINSKISEYNNLNEINNNIKLNEEKIFNLKKENESLSKKIKNGRIFTSLIFIFSLITIVATIYTYIRGLKKVAIPLLIVGIFIFVIFLIKKKLNINKEKKSVTKCEELKKLSDITEQLKERAKSIEKDLSNIMNQYKGAISNDVDIVVALTEIKTRYIKYKDLKNNINLFFEKQNKIVKKFKELKGSVKKYLLNYFKEVTDPYINYVHEIKLKKREYLKEIKYYEEKLKQKTNFENTNNISKEDLNENGKDFNKEEIEKKIKDLNKEINRLNDEKNYNKNQIEMLESNLETVFEIENEIEELNQNIQEMQDECNILEKTKKLLETAKNQFSSHYLGGMEENFINNLKLINEKEINANIDVNLNVKINEQGSNKEIRYFSTGYKDLIYICMRLSLINSLFEKEKPFIILDDPFVNLDKAKTQNAINLLKSISKEYQIIYFICHESRK